MPHPVEEGSGTPSFRPLWRLMPYLWPQARPDLRARVVLSIVPRGQQVLALPGSEPVSVS